MTVLKVKPFVGQHCESTTLVNLLNHHGHAFSEAMVFGLGRGLNYVYWKTDSMEYPFIGGRTRPDSLTENVAEALELKVQSKRTDSELKAWQNLTEDLDAGHMVGLKLDSYFLDYCHEDFHFAAHYVACYGYDEHKAYLVDTKNKQGVHTTSLESLADARAYRGPMSSKSLSFTLTPPARLPDLRERVPQAIARNAEAFLHPPIKNMGFKGIRKTSELMPRWMETLDDPGRNLRTLSTLMERAGTGGGNFRALYSRFLEESAQLTGNAFYRQVAARYHDMAGRWTQVAQLLDAAAVKREPALLEEAAGLMVDLADDEEQAMEALHAEASGKRRRGRGPARAVRTGRRMAHVN
ncbi:BtrH N-terminal domain-containing protein [Myxococcus sp. K15C18031901]|uniref:BtrH N-terminal domain-containing protein n=1 Tax=Myxococcus dinghuensis TaxID=2906761 RepID=UPI0020A83743|nr:BtrH N-terminal domain-containing protein [Myxococcus dinghuensis]MCP3098103.1 BtrH N-terminal domain-containing protein [Myxococcus dinghuensis]